MSTRVTWPNLTLRLADDDQLEFIVVGRSFLAMSWYQVRRSDNCEEPSRVPFMGFLNQPGCLKSALPVDYWWISTCFFFVASHQQIRVIFFLNLVWWGWSFHKWMLSPFWVNWIMGLWWSTITKTWSHSLGPCVWVKINTLNSPLFFRSSCPIIFCLLGLPAKFQGSLHFDRLANYSSELRCRWESLTREHYV